MPTSAGTAAVWSLARLPTSRKAKERLSAETATVVPAELPGFSSDIRLTRTELENLIEEPLAACSTRSKKCCSATRFGWQPAAVATVGGGEHPAGHPAAVRASACARGHHAVPAQRGGGRGAAADRGLSADAPTGLASAADAPTDMATAAWPQARPEWRLGIGCRRRPVGDLPRAGVVAGRRTGRRAGAVRRRRLQLRLRPGLRGPLPVAFGPGGGRLSARAGTVALVQAPADPVRRRGRRGAARRSASGVTLTNTSGNTGPVTETATTVSTEPHPGSRRHRPPRRR